MKKLFSFTLIVSILLTINLSLHAQTQKQSTKDIPQRSTKTQRLQHQAKLNKKDFPNGLKKASARSRYNVKSQVNPQKEYDKQIQSLEFKIAQLKTQTPQTADMQRAIFRLEQHLVIALEQKSFAEECK